MLGTFFWLSDEARTATGAQLHVRSLRAGVPMARPPKCGR